MERTITAILTNSNDKKVFNSNATTLGELKAEMTAQGIDYHNMDFMEGLTHTTMIDDAAILPSNVNYKGQITNNLVFMLSTTNKQIRSGMYTRQECYAKVKEMNLQEDVKNKFGKNFTQVSTDDLNTMVEKAEKKCAIPTDRKGLYEYINKNNIADDIKTLTGKNYTILSTERLIEACKKINKFHGIKTPKCAPKSEEKRVKQAAVKKVAMKSPYSDSELDAIIRGLRK